MFVMSSFDLYPFILEISKFNKEDNSLFLVKKVNKKVRHLPAFLQAIIFKLDVGIFCRTSIQWHRVPSELWVTQDCGLYVFFPKKVFSLVLGGLW